MELNLRKARKLESKISSHIEKTQLPTEVGVRIKGSITEALTKVQEGSKLVDTNLQTLINLNDLRFSIRARISQANEGVGINALMNQREALRQRNGILNKLAQTKNALSNEELSDLLVSQAKAVDAGNVRSYLPDASVSTQVPVVSQSVKDLIQTSIANTLKSLEDVEDQLAQKNLGAVVTLSDDDVSLLQSEGLL